MEAPQNTAMAAELLALRQAVGRIRETDQYCDLKLLCRGREFKVHKAIVCDKSSVLAAAVKENFKEAETGEIRIVGFDVHSVKCMIDFFYGGKYDDGIGECKPKENVKQTETNQEPQADQAAPSQQTATKDTEKATAKANGEKPPSPNDIIQRNIQVSQVADYYDIAPLAKLAKEKVDNILKNNWEADGFLPILQVIASGSVPDKSLCRSIIAYAAYNWDELEQDDAFDHFLKNNSFAMELALSITACWDLKYRGALLDATKSRTELVNTTASSDDALNKLSQEKTRTNNELVQLRASLKDTLNKLSQEKTRVNTELARSTASFGEALNKVSEEKTRANTELARANAELARVNASLTQAWTRVTQEQARASTEKSKANTERRRADAIIANATKVHNRLNGQDSCRNCNDYFGCYIETYEPSNQPTYLLRCANCLCRHYTD